MTDKDRINHLDEQCRSLLAEKNKLQAELSAFHAAMERERKADWEKWHNDLADRLENPSPDRTVAVDDARTAARELRYMADSFTLKANFVPAELKIKELEAERDAANRDAKATSRALLAIVKWRRLQVLSRGETPAAIARKALGLPKETIQNNSVHGKI